MPADVADVEVTGGNSLGSIVHLHDVLHFGEAGVLGVADVLPPLASLVASLLGPTASARLSLCGPVWHRLAPTRLRGTALERWASEHWPPIFEKELLPCSPTSDSNADGAGAEAVGAAEEAQETVNGDGERSLEAVFRARVWPSSPRGITAMVDRAFIVAAQHPQALSMRDARGISPLHHAARKRCGPLVHVLLTLKASPDFQDSGGRTPLHIAAAAGDARCTGLLLQARADANSQDMLRRIPLELAARVRAEAVQELLLASMEASAPPTCAGDSTCVVL
eukprot:TRINITY_DN65083_c0_g1_i1.p2 TRINITY_DN65083_c0_g1~~TRINITY_DN65083_c0_g1_i1.p2  ORF type:complete len:280 (+),score=52.71 TRINITY_DN65083_c0_g1_i1:39-878(+)